MDIQELRKCAEKMWGLLHEEKKIKREIAVMEERLHDECGLTRPEIRALKRRLKREVFEARTGMPMPENVIYFALCEELCLVKIGTSRDPDKRIKSIQSSVKKPLVSLGCVPGGFDEERGLHRFFHPYRVRGEWFDYSSPLAKKIDRIIAANEIPKFEVQA